jgi:mycothiol synthase
MRSVRPIPATATSALAHLLARFGDDTATDEEAAALVPELADAARRANVEALVIEAEPATDALTSAAAASGFALFRTTWQLRRPLPIEGEQRGSSATIEARPFEVGRDERGWIEVNNRAFAWHPDQSERTLEDLLALEAEPWFRPDGFLLHDDAHGRLDGFCWTKIHETEPPLGEIYVIGVDPLTHGQGLGRALVLAGLDWLHAQGIADAMLYVEDDNAPARHLYRSMGFVEHHAHRWWRLDP